MWVPMTQPTEQPVKGVVEPLPLPVVRRPRTTGPGLYPTALASWLPAVGQTKSFRGMPRQHGHGHSQLTSLAEASTLLLLGRNQALTSS